MIFGGDRYKPVAPDRVGYGSGHDCGKISFMLRVDVATGDPPGDPRDNARERGRANALANAEENGSPCLTSIGAGEWS